MVASFLPYRSIYKSVRKEDHRARKIDPIQFYDQMVAAPATARYGVALEQEKNWHAFGEPYVKVFPGIGGMMRQTSIDIPAEHLIYPFPCFAVLFPVELGLSVRAVLTGCDRQGDDIHLWATVQTQEFWESGGEVVQGGLSLLFEAGEQIEAKLSDRSAPVHSDPGGGTAESLVRLIESGEILDMWRVVICTAFFATDRHELVMPDWPRRKYRQWEKARERNDHVALSRFLGMAAEARNLSVGREIELPQPVASESGTHGDATGRHLHHAHMRRGHLKMQPHGQRRSQRKLIFVPPTIVRPDLPFATGGQGYKITDL